MVVDTVLLEELSGTLHFCMQGSNSRDRRTLRVERIALCYRSSLSAIDWAIRRAERNSNIDRAGSLRLSRNTLVRERDLAIVVEQARLSEHSVQPAVGSGERDQTVDDTQSTGGRSSQFTIASVTEQLDSIDFSQADLSAADRSEHDLSLRRFLLDRDLQQISQVLSHWSRDPSDLLDFTVSLNFSQTSNVWEDLRVHLRSISLLISDIRGILLEENPSQDEFSG